MTAQKTAVDIGAVEWKQRRPPVNFVVADTVTKFGAGSNNGTIRRRQNPPRPSSPDETMGN